MKNNIDKTIIYPDRCRYFDHDFAHEYKKFLRNKNLRIMLERKMIMAKIFLITKKIKVQFFLKIMISLLTQDLIFVYMILFLNLIFSLKFKRRFMI